MNTKDTKQDQARRKGNRQMRDTEKDLRDLNEQVRAAHIALPAMGLTLTDAAPRAWSMTLTDKGGNMVAYAFSESGVDWTVRAGKTRRVISGKGRAFVLMVKLLAEEKEKRERTGAMKLYIDRVEFRSGGMLREGYAVVDENGKAVSLPKPSRYLADKERAELVAEIADYERGTGRRPNRDRKRGAVKWSAS